MTANKTETESKIDPHKCEDPESPPYYLVDSEGKIILDTVDKDVAIRERATKMGDDRFDLGFPIVVGKKDRDKISH